MFSTLQKWFKGEDNKTDKNIALQNEYAKSVTDQDIDDDWVIGSHESKKKDYFEEHPYELNKLFDEKLQGVLDVVLQQQKTVHDKESSFNKAQSIHIGSGNLQKMQSSLKEEKELLDILENQMADLYDDKYSYVKEGFLNILCAAKNIAQDTASLGGVAIAGAASTKAFAGSFYVLQGSLNLIGMGSWTWPIYTMVMMNPGSVLAATVAMSVAYFGHPYYTDIAKNLHDICHEVQYISEKSGFTDWCHSSADTTMEIASQYSQQLQKYCADLSGNREDVDLSGISHNSEEWIELDVIV